MKPPKEIELENKRYKLMTERLNPYVVRVVYRPDGEESGNPPIVSNGTFRFPLSSIGNTEEEAEEDLLGRLHLCSNKNKDVKKALKSHA